MTVSKFTVLLGLAALIMAQEFASQRKRSIKFRLSHSSDDDDDDSSSSSSSLSSSSVSSSDITDEHQLLVKTAIDNADQRKQRQRVRCDKLDRVWPETATGACPAASSVRGFVNLIMASLVPSPGWQYTYYSPICGRLSMASGIKRVDINAGNVDKRTLMPLASLSKPVITGTMHRLVELGVFNYLDPLSKFIPELFLSERVTIENIIGTPRTPYDNTRHRVNGTCIQLVGFNFPPNPNSTALSPVVYLFPSTLHPQVGEYSPASNIAEGHIELENAAGPHRDQCSDQITQNFALMVIIAERVLGKPFDEIAEQHFLRDEAVCYPKMGPLDYRTPTLGIPPATLGGAGANWAPYHRGYNATTVEAAAISVQSGETIYVGGNAFGSADALLRIFHGILENEYFTPTQQALYEKSYEVCENLFLEEQPAVDIGKCAAYGFFLSTSVNKSSFWGFSSFVRIRSMTGVQYLEDMSLFNTSGVGQVTVLPGAFGATAFRFDQFGAYQTMTTNGATQVIYAAGISLAELVPRIFDPAFCDPATREKYCLFDSTSRLQSQSLVNGDNESLGPAIGLGVHDSCFAPTCPVPSPASIASATESIAAALQSFDVNDLPEQVRQAAAVLMAA